MLDFMFQPTVKKYTSLDHCASFLEQELMNCYQMLRNIQEKKVYYECVTEEHVRGYISLLREAKTNVDQSLTWVN